MNKTVSFKITLTKGDKNEYEVTIPLEKLLARFKVTVPENTPDELLKIILAPIKIKAQNLKGSRECANREALEQFYMLKFASTDVEVEEYIAPEKVATGDPNVRLAKDIVKTMRGRGFSETQIQEKINDILFQINNK